MESHSSEQVPEARDSLLFDDLEVGDSIILETESGSTYRLLVSETEDKTFVTLERQSDHDVKEDEATSWKRIEPGSTFTLEGSCKQMLLYGDSPVVSGETKGQFTVGERAWFEMYADGTRRTLVTSSVQNIETHKPAEI